jgi:putative flippase GtrA
MDVAPDVARSDIGERIGPNAIRGRTDRRLLARFLVTGVVSVGADVLLLFLLHGPAGIPVLPAAATAYGTSLVVNYSLNHAWVFETQGGHGPRIARYLTLMAMTYSLTLVLVAGLSAAGLYYLLAKAVSVAVVAVVNFTGYRLWVFR